MVTSNCLGGFATDIERDKAHDALDLIELMFFAYRDFTAEADNLLADVGLGRAHHRVLHFVAHHEGITINQLLDILDITKQSLSRVLHKLVDDGFIDVRVSTEDRRKRMLFPGEKGVKLYQTLLALQTRQIEQAVATVHGADVAVIKTFLSGLIRRDRRTDALDIINKRGHIFNTLNTGS